MRQAQNPEPETLLPVDYFRVQRFDDWSGRLLRDGRDTGVNVSGGILRGAYAWGSMHLLLIEDCNGFEAFLHVHMFDSQLRLVDAAQIGFPYGAGLFNSPKIESANRISFEFIGDKRWHVAALARRNWRVPFFSEPLGVWREFGFRRHFVVSVEA